MYFLTAATLCNELSDSLQIVGQVINVYKLFLPLILIVLGIFDIGKTVISTKSEDIKKNMKNLFKKVLVCALIYFIPTIIMALFGLITMYQTDVEESGVNYDLCYDCLFKPNGENCTNAVEEIKKERETFDESDTDSSYESTLLESEDEEEYWNDDYSSDGDYSSNEEELLDY